ncbi:hypothetical protein [Agromyces sp. Marseille-Q5079]|uniref:hypothetical protein n=1 Tax=Agromyces sp. Marseille-Q5079 TaxID=3439059 RepID=UPI003D9C7D2D
MRRGVYAAAARPREPEWLVDERRHLHLVHAVGETMSAPIFTGFSALALHGLPTFGRWPAQVSVVSGTGHGRRRNGIVWVAACSEPPLAVASGRRVTSVEFTLIQVCRAGTLAAGLAAVDAALWVPRHGDRSPRTTLERLRAEHERLLPYPGSRRVEAVLSRATSRSETVLETASRLVIEELGFAAPALQHEFWLPELGMTASVDFAWPAVGAVAEADGRGKYGSGEGASAAAAWRLVIAEKDRENAIRRQVRGFDRWDWSDMARKVPIEQRLTRIGVPRVRRRRSLIGRPTDPALRSTRAPATGGTPLSETNT